MQKGQEFSLYSLEYLDPTEPEVGHLPETYASFIPPQGRTLLQTVEGGRNQEASLCGRKAVMLGVRALKTYLSP